jgi:ribose 5-phosphate isomerase A
MSPPAPSPAADLDREKALAAARAVEEVRDGMLVGLGTGSTSVHAIRAVGRLVAGGLRVTATATSLATEHLARSLGIPLVPFESLSAVDLTIDGADEVDGRLRAIKGGGGALLREKIVAAASARMVVAVDSSKPVETLGRFKLPLEVLPFAAAWVGSSVAALGATVTRRLRADGMAFLTDQGNCVLDAAFGAIDDPERLAARLDAIPGLLGHGLFLTEIDAVYIGRGDRVDTLTRPA